MWLQKTYIGLSGPLTACRAAIVVTERAGLIGGITLEDDDTWVNRDHNGILSADARVLTE